MCMQSMNGSIKKQPNTYLLSLIFMESISKMSDSEPDSEPEEQSMEDEAELSMYRKMETDEIRNDMETPTVQSFKPKPHVEDDPDNTKGYIYPIRIKLDFVISTCSLQKKIVSVTIAQSRILMAFPEPSTQKVSPNTFIVLAICMDSRQRKERRLETRARIYRST